MRSLNVCYHKRSGRINGPLDLEVLWRHSAGDFVKAMEQSRGACVLPIGIIEKHGPHLPLGSDLIQVRYAAAHGAGEMVRNGCKKIVVANGDGGNSDLLPFFAQSQLASPRTTAMRAKPKRRT